MYFSSSEILSVGTELLLGDIVNTDAAYLARALAVLGIPCYHQSVVGDNPARLRAVLSDALARSELVILTGGLGPTCDDLTKETAAALMGKTLTLHAPSYDRIRTLLEKRGLPETENQKKQAMLPEDAVVFENDWGTAPGFAMTADTEFGQRTVILLPGPPRELEPMFDVRVRPYLASGSEETIWSMNIGLWGIGEAAVEQVLRRYMTESANPTAAPYCGEGDVRLRLTARGRSEEECRAMCRSLAEELCAVSCEPYKPGILSDYVFGIDCTSLSEALVGMLREKHLTVSAAESCTGGYIAKRITDTPGASEVLSGSFVTYSEQAKQALVGVRAETLAEYSVYSEQVAAEMARGCREAVGADIGIGVTGVAGAEDAVVLRAGEAHTVSAGTVFVACAVGNDVRVERIVLAPGRRAGTEAREYVRARASQQALFMALCAARAL
ncbi:MAG: competence/damage-inducible protein A [Clostridia bacterium]|nr:competence/damage-inducible protein A [Clostridia bacterium]